jgi:hypothetical protein
LAALICLLPLSLSLALDDLRDLLVFLDIFAKPFFCRFARCLSGESPREPLGAPRWRRIKSRHAPMQGYNQRPQARQRGWVQL